MKSNKDLLGTEGGPFGWANRWSLDDALDPFALLATWGGRFDVPDKAILHALPAIVTTSVLTASPADSGAAKATKN
jgi:hypothetical protein